MPADSKKNIEETWDIVLKFYGSEAFRNKKTGVIGKPKHDKIQFLYDEMIKLGNCMFYLNEQKKISIDRMLSWGALVPPEKSIQS